MKIRSGIYFVVVLLSPLGSVFGQPFTNLSFESAVLVPVPGDNYRRVEFGAAFPGWIGYVGGVQESVALTNNMFLNSSGIGLINRGWPYGGAIGGPIAGNFTAFLQAGFRLFSNPLE